MTEPGKSGKRGRFITFEGTDGSGKTTQMTLVADRLRSAEIEVVETQEPGGTSIGLQIRRILLNSENQGLCPTAEMLLYFAARAQNFDERILPAWDRGAVVLSDRFTDSTLAYQGDGRGLGHSVVMTLHDIACHGLQPDLTVCIDIDLETALERARERNKDQQTRDRMDEQARDFHERVRQAYLKLGEVYPERIRIIDGRGRLEDVANRVWAVVEPVVRERRGV
jgi:dTMP kinase